MDRIAHNKAIKLASVGRVCTGAGYKGVVCVQKEEI